MKPREAMKPKEALKELWKTGFFKTRRVNTEIASHLLEDHGATTANINAVLKNCKEFLRKDGKGWIQRTNYTNGKSKKEKNMDYFTMLNIHPRIQRVSRALYQDGHYSQAILEAFKAVNNLVKEKSERVDLDGKNLMLTVFSKDTPILALNNNSTTSEKNEQEGFMHLFAGAMLGIRNPKAHDEIVQKDPKVTLQYLAFASVLCRMVDKSQKVR